MITFVVSDGERTVSRAAAMAIAKQSRPISEAIEVAGDVVSDHLKIPLDLPVINKWAVDRVVEYSMCNDANNLRSMTHEQLAVLFETALFIRHTPLAEDVVTTLALYVDPKLLDSPAALWRSYLIEEQNKYRADKEEGNGMDMHSLTCEVAKGIRDAWSKESVDQKMPIIISSDGTIESRLRTAIENDEPVETIKDLVDMCPTLNFVYDEDRETPLRLALHNARLETVTLLVSRGAQCFAKTHKKPMETAQDLLVAAIAAKRRRGRAAERYPVDTNELHHQQADKAGALFEQVLLQASKHDAPMMAEALLCQADYERIGIVVPLWHTMVCLGCLASVMGKTRGGRFGVSLDILNEIAAIFASFPDIVHDIETNHLADTTSAAADIREPLIKHMREKALERIEELSKHVPTNLLWHVAKRVGFPGCPTTIVML